MPKKLTREQVVEKIKQNKIAREQDVLLYEEIENLKDEIESKLKIIDELLKSDKIFKDLFYSARGVKSSGDNLLDDLVEYIKKDSSFVKSITGEDGTDAVVDYDFILKEILKNIRQPKDGETPIIDYKKIINETVKEVSKNIPKPDSVDTYKIISDASNKAVEELKLVIPTIEQIERDLPTLGEPIRDSLEILQGDERLDISAIKGLEDYKEVSQNSKQSKVVAGGSTARNFYQLKDTPKNYSGKSGKIVSVKTTEDGLEFRSLVASDIPDLSLGVFQPADATLTALAALDASVGILKQTGADTFSKITDNSANWDTAYGWGNHALAGYALSANVIAKSLFNVNTILYATTDDTPVALTVGEQTVVGRATGGEITAIAIDSDLSSVSANNDTIPSAKAAKAYTDTKLTIPTDDSNIAGVRHQWHISLVNPNAVVTASSVIPICALTDAALTITKIVVSTSSASYEAAGDLKYADARIGLANPVVVNDFDTTSGIRSDTTITSAAVASGKFVYLSFDSAPNALMTDVVIDVYFNYD